MKGVFPYYRPSKIKLEIGWWALTALYYYTKTGRNQLGKSKRCPQSGVFLVNKKRVEASLREKKRDGTIIIGAADVHSECAYALRVNDERDVEIELQLRFGSVDVVTQYVWFSSITLLQLRWVFDEY